MSDYVPSDNQFSAMSLSTAVTDPPALSELQRPSVHRSDAPIDDAPPPPYDDAYEGLNWGRIPGYIRPNNTSDRRGWYWEHGFEVQKGTDEKNCFWLCKSCHQKKPHKSYSFASRGVENIKNNMLIQLRRAAYSRLEIESLILLGGGGCPPCFEGFLRFLPRHLSQVCQRWLSALRLWQQGRCFCQFVGLFVAGNVCVARYPAHLCSSVWCG